MDKKWLITNPRRTKIFKLDPIKPQLAQIYATFGSDPEIVPVIPPSPASFQPVAKPLFFKTAAPLQAAVFLSQTMCYIERMAQIIPIFEQYSNETPEETWARHKKETCALLKVYAHLADNYQAFLEKKYGLDSIAATSYDFAGEESSYRAHICLEWMEMYYHYHPLQTEQHRLTSEHYRLYYHTLYERKIEEIKEKMDAADYQDYLKTQLPTPCL